MRSVALALGEDFALAYFWGGGAAAPDSSVTAHRNERRRRSIGNSVEREGKRAKTVLPLRSISVDDNVARHSQCEL